MNALTEIQQEGMVLFESIGCVQCHSGPNFSGASLGDSENAAVSTISGIPGSPVKLKNTSWQMTLGAAISRFSTRIVVFGEFLHCVTFRSQPPIFTMALWNHYGRQFVIMASVTAGFRI